jgi:serine/threonine-protein kinase
VKVGEVIDGKYELVRLLGEGGMGSVWEGRHVHIGRRAALKFLHPQVAHNADIASRFLREAQAAAAIGSDHIVDIYDVGQLKNGVPFLVMEYLDGEDLASVLKREGRLEPARAVELILQLCEALQPAHAQGIVHRDLKPGNLFLTRLGKQEGWLKVLDFGIAKVRGSVTGQASEHLTRTGATMGTPYYMAPEQFMGARNVDPRADVYSAGVILYQMLTWTTPYSGETYEELIINVAAGGARPPHSLRHDLDEVLSQVVLRAMAREIERRFPSMDALAEALRPFAARGRTSNAPSTVVQPPAPAYPVPPAVVPRTEVTPVEQTLPQTSVPAPLVVRPTVYRPPITQVTPSDVATTPTAWESPGKRPGPMLWIGLGGAAVVVAAIVVGVVAMNGGDEDDAPDPSQEPVEIPRIPNVTAAASVESGHRSDVRPATAGPEPSPSNRWVRIEAAARDTVLGLPAEMSGSDDRGFRASRAVTAPTHPYEIQQHEVTWQELRPWLEQHPEHAVTQPTWLPVESSERYPATAVPWTTAGAYCRSLGGSLPTEEEWEYAARGMERRPYPWGTGDVDLSKTHAYRPGRPLSPAMTNEQDRTPGEVALAIHDLLGNAQEWTADVWREDSPGRDESWVQSGEMSFRAVRGLPPAEEQPSSLPFIGSAHRMELCATGACPGETGHLLAYVGFRCSRRAR